MVIEAWTGEENERRNNESINLPAFVIPIPIVSSSPPPLLPFLPFATIESGRCINLSRGSLFLVAKAGRFGKEEKEKKRKGVAQPINSM